MAKTKTPKVEVPVETAPEIIPASEKLFEEDDFADLDALVEKASAPMTKTESVSIYDLANEKDLLSGDETQEIFAMVNQSAHPSPAFATSGSSGMDICANLERGFKLFTPGETATIPTGIFVQLPEGYEIQVRPRSGMSSKKQLFVILGTVDSDYRGEIGVIIHNGGRSERVIQDGDRIAQLVLAKVEKRSFQEFSSVDQFSKTLRGSNGFGSTGK